MIKTIKLKELIKYLVGLIAVVLIAVNSTRFFSNLNKSSCFFDFNIDFKKIFKSSITIANYNVEETTVEKESYASSRSGLTRILEMELPNIV